MKKAKKTAGVIVLFLMLVPFVSWAQSGQGAMSGGAQGNQIKAQVQARAQAVGQGINQAGDTATQRRSRIANAAQQMLQVAERNQGIGQRIRVMAQAQNQDQEQIETKMKEVKNRGRLRKFFFGPDYKGLNSVKDRLANHEERIAELKEMASQITNEGDAQILEEQIAAMEQVKAELEEEVGDQSKGFSLFGWLMKRFAK